MLSRLIIENIGLTDRIAVDFPDKLNILTGSTGAGKSILIDGLRFALGDHLPDFHGAHDHQLLFSWNPWLMN